MQASKEALEIRALCSSEYAAAIRIKQWCWQNDYAGVVPLEAFDYGQELEFLHEWMQGPPSDLRLAKGAYVNDVLVGFVAASRAGSADSESGIEVNYLFVDGRHRNSGIALRLLQTILKDYGRHALKDVIVYNWHDAGSSTFYSHLNGKVIRGTIQRAADREMKVDVFLFELRRLLDRIGELQAQATHRGAPSAAEQV
jgi:GNAT superfamily N-acetyltransferase